MKRIARLFITLLIIIQILISCDFPTNLEESKIYRFYGSVLDYDENTPIDSAEVYIFKSNIKSSGNSFSYGKKTLGQCLTTEGEYILELKTSISITDPVYLTAKKKGCKISLKNSNLSWIIGGYTTIRYKSQGNRNIKIDILMERNINL